jgi:hypothetical protein
MLAYLKFTLCLALVVSPLVRAEDIPANLPDKVEPSRCRTVSVSAEEIERQWKLYHSHAQELRVHDLFTDRERIGLRQNGLTPEYVQCFVGSNVFSAMCFAKGTNTTLQLESIKLFSGPAHEVCMVIANLRRK